MARPRNICRECGETILVKNIAETRKQYPSNEVTYLCVSCKQEQLRQHIADTRRWLGLADQGS